MCVPEMAMRETREPVPSWIHICAAGGRRAQTRCNNTYLPETLEIAFRIDERHGEQPTDKNDRPAEFEARTEAFRRVRSDIDNVSHHPRRGQPGQRLDCVADAEHGAALAHRTDLTDKGGTQCVDDAAYREGYDDERDLLVGSS